MTFLLSFITALAAVNDKIDKKLSYDYDGDGQIESLQLRNYQTYWVKGGAYPIKNIYGHENEASNGVNVGRL